MLVDGIEFTATNFCPSDSEARAYVDYVRARVRHFDSVRVNLCPDDTVEITWLRKSQKFERIRRITGYLVGTTDRWNDAKISEEKDRVKHDIRLYDAVS